MLPALLPMWLPPASAAASAAVSAAACSRSLLEACPHPPPNPLPCLHWQLRAGNVLGDALEGETEGFDAIHVGAGTWLGGEGCCCVVALLLLPLPGQPLLQRCGLGGWLRAGSCLANLHPAFPAPAAASSLPDVLVRKLRNGGRMVIPVGGQWEYQVRGMEGEWRAAREQDAHAV